MSSALPVPVHAFVEPAETGRFAPENAMVDLIDNALRAGVAFGLAPQIMRRIAAIEDLAAPCVAPPDTASRSRPEGTENSGDGLTASIFAGAGDLHLSALIGELGRVEKLKLNGLAHAAVASIKSQAAAALATIVAERTVSKPEAA